MTTQNALEFADQYNKSRKKTAECVLSTASIYFAAWNLLSGSNDYKIFLDEIGEKENSSYLKKLKCIAKKESRFRAVIDLLPPSSASIYELSQIEDQLFDIYVQKGAIYPSMTLKDAENLKSKITSKSSSVSSKICVKIEILDLDSIRQFAIDLNALQQQYNLIVHQDALEKALSVVTSSSNEKSFEDSSESMTIRV